MAATRLQEGVSKTAPKCGLPKKTSGNSSVTEIAKSKVAEILIFGVPEASGPCGLIHLVKLVSQVLTRAHNLPYGAKIYKKCITNQKYTKNSRSTAPAAIMLLYV